MPDAADLNNVSDLSALANPYDFAKPVTRRDRFAGRAKELKDIGYYLALAEQTPEPMNLAIIGERASGKTSLLNIIDIEARKSGLITARINLNTADAEPISFFWKLYDAVIDSYCTAGHLFKPGSDEDIVYRRIIDALDLTADSPSFPLRFPGHYALAVKGSRQISEVKLQRDLTYIYDQVNIPCVLIFDECNIMTQNRVTLEMLRNVFMNISGYMIVLTGTPSFFPMLDEVFSPIIRQFKKINIQPFADRGETRQCVFSPLRSLSVNPAKLVSYSALSDIHAISRGRPYEIQLLCHFMFRRLQDQRAAKMDITADVMDDVLNELEATITDTVERPIVAVARNMTEEQLASVTVFGRANGYGDFGLAWLMNGLSSSAGRFTRQELLRLLDELKGLGVLEVREDGKIYFAGDDFDRIYLRYHAERLGLSVDINDDFPGEFRLAILLTQSLRDAGMKIVQAFREITLDKALNDLFSSPMGELPETSLFTLGPVVAALDHGKLTVAVVTLSYGGDETVRASVSAWWLFNDEYSLTDDPAYMELKETVESRGGIMSTVSSTFDLPPEDELIAKLLSSSNKQLKKQFGTLFATEASEMYLKGEDDAALTQARRARLFPLEPTWLNNLGYVYMAMGHHSDAEPMIRQASMEAREVKDYKTAALALYNSAMCAVLGDHKDDAAGLLSQSRQMIAADPEENYELRCLLIPVIDSQSLVLKEMWDPELSSAIDAAVASLEASPNPGKVGIIRVQPQ